MNSDKNYATLTNFSVLRNDSNLLDLEQQCHLMVKKIDFLETQLRESRTEIQVVNFSKMELERTLDRERRELADVKAQLKVIQGTMQYWEQERTNKQDTYVIQSLQLESSQSERNSYSEQIKNLEVQNMELKLKMEDYQKQLQNYNQLESLVISKKKVTDTILEKIYGESQKLEKEFLALKKRVSVAKYIGEQMIYILKYHHKALNHAYEENKILKQSQIVLEGELKHLKSSKGDDVQNSAVDDEIQVLQTTLKEHEDMVSEFSCKLTAEIEEKNKLKESLKNILEEQIKFNKLENYLRDRISELEERLEKRFEEEMN